MRRGYAVIFLHRQFSLQPFARHYRHADELILDMFEVPAEGDVPELKVKPQFQPQIKSDLREYHKVRTINLVIL